MVAPAGQLGSAPVLSAMHTPQDYENYTRTGIEPWKASRSRTSHAAGTGGTGAGAGVTGGNGGNGAAVPATG
jgi:hypothetical protein